MNDMQPEKDLTTTAAHPVCPPWCCFTFDNPFRKLLQNPNRILRPYIKPGWTVLDVGPGMGYFTIPLAKLVGDKGKVIAADIQHQMLDSLDHRAFKAGVQERIKLRLTKTDSIGISESIDFCLAFWMVHEVPDRVHFLSEIVSNLKPDGLMLIAEPRIHVSKEHFAKTLEIAKNAGLSVIDTPKIFFSYAALLKK
jgi:ubiquinone/menaquinone biosynthesis C-methylase UbiE